MNIIIQLKTIHIGVGSGSGSGRVRLFVGNRGSGRVNVSAGRVGSRVQEKWPVDNSDPAIVRTPHGIRQTRLTARLLKGEIYCVWNHSGVRWAGVFVYRWIGKDRLNCNTVEVWNSEIVIHGSENLTKIWKTRTVTVEYRSMSWNVAGTWRRAVDSLKRNLLTSYNYSESTNDWKEDLLVSHCIPWR